MKVASIVLVFLSAAFARNHTETHVCSDQFMAVDANCGDRSEMDKCFETCMAERGMLVLDTYEMAACAGLTDTLCACGNRCSSSDDCKSAMIATLNCNLANELNCEGYTCPKPSFSLQNGGLGMMRTARSRFRK
mmetsp:Transcript_56707/g.120406  ORF Transcript_56707/g.120406 Transcript_56707/m.120406 type:complete len:134 (-) Transcript_56707:58-459(-)